MDPHGRGDDSPIEFPAQSPWSQPPVHRPAPRREPAPQSEHEPRAVSDADDAFDGDDESTVEDDSGDQPGPVFRPTGEPMPPPSTLVTPSQRPPYPEPDRRYQASPYAAPHPHHPYQDVEVDLPGTSGLSRLLPNRIERESRASIAAVRRAFGGLRQITVVNPRRGAGKTVATLMLGLAFGQTRGGYVLAWDNDGRHNDGRHNDGRHNEDWDSNEPDSNDWDINGTQGSLGGRSQPDVHSRTIRDLLRDLGRFGGPGGQIGELSSYVRAQADGAFDVLASDEAILGATLTATAFREVRDVVGRFYQLLLVDTGDTVRSENWQAALDATDQLVIPMSAENDSAETAAWLLDLLEQTGRQELLRRAVAVVTRPRHRDRSRRAIERHFDRRCRTVLHVPYDRHLDSGAPVEYGALSPESRRAWLRVAAAVADGL